MSDEAEVTVLHEPQRHRYVLLIGDQLIGEALYRDAEGFRTFTHTEVVPEYEHHGLGTVLVRDALADSAASGVRSIGACSLVRTYLAEHPDAGAPR